MSRNDDATPFMHLHWVSGRAAGGAPGGLSWLVLQQCVMRPSIANLSSPKPLESRMPGDGARYPLLRRGKGLALVNLLSSGSPALLAPCTLQGG